MSQKLIYILLLCSIAQAIPFSIDEPIAVAQFRISAYFPTQESKPFQENYYTSVVKPLVLNYKYIVNDTELVIINPLITNITLIDNNTIAVWDVPANVPMVDLNCQGLLDIWIDRTSIIGGATYQRGYLYATIPEPFSLILFLTGIWVLYIIAKDRKEFF